jgi:hypothetical protein
MTVRDSAQQEPRPALPTDSATAVNPWASVGIGGQGFNAAHHLASISLKSYALSGVMLERGQS